MENIKPFKILCIDGGGIRGIFPARLLCEIEEELIRMDVKDPRLFNYFDLICGTSTGGIIALGLALGMTAKELLLLYNSNAKTIFPGKPGILEYLLRPKYSIKPLSLLLKNTFKELSPGGDTRLGHALTRVCIPTFNAYLGKAHVYKTPHHKDLIRDYQIPAHDVALSTAAAPIFFAPHTFEYKNINSSSNNMVINNIDGGIVANNPTMIGIVEAHCALEVPMEQIKVLSLGTGHLEFSENSPKRKFGLAYWSEKARLVEMLFSAQAQNTDNLVKFFNNGLGESNNSKFYYKRVQHSFRKGNGIEMDECDNDKIFQLEEIGTDYYKLHGSEILKEFFKENKRDYEPLKQL